MSRKAIESLDILIKDRQMITIPEVKHDREKIDSQNYKKSNAVTLVYRWAILALVVVLSIPAIRFKPDGYAILETLSAAFIYNSAITALIIKGNFKENSIILYFDILVLAVISFFSGGIDSDAYLFLFFLLGYCGILKDAGYTIRVGFVCAVFYTFSCIFAAGMDNQAPDYIRLLVRDIVFIMGAFGISRINFEVKKYDEMRKKEFRLARTDKLTGLANRHYFDQKLQDEVEYADHSGSTLNVLIFDLDNFKSFNDTYGHISGDKLLKLFSDIIIQCIRKTDIPVRYGGEEFLILIRDLDIYIAKNVGERIRRQLEKQRIYLGGQEDKRKITVSCGLAQYPLHSKNIKEVVELADKALYKAKENGKNTVVIYGEEIGNSSSIF